MIYLYTGTPGSGKSLHAAEDVFYQRMRGGVTIANCPFNESGFLASKKAQFWQLPDDPARLIDFSKDYFKSHRFREEELLIVIDECQLIFNARTWNDSSRKDWIRFFTQHRKYGYKIILITQFAQMIDKQIRALVEIEVIHRKASSLGFVMSCISFFFGGRLHLASYNYSGMHMHLKTKFFLRNPLYESMYNTHMTWE